VLSRLRQEGCLRARFPRRLVPGWADVVTLNTSGGIAGGDRLDIALELGAGAQATVAAQAAERFYRRNSGDLPSAVSTEATLAAGSMLEWLPQETILFDRCGLDRKLNVTLSGDARFLGLETLVFGRTAMGESVRKASIRDLIRITRDRVLLLHDVVRLEGEVVDKLARPSIANGGCAVATIVYVGRDAEERLERVRAGLTAGPEVGVSAWNGMLVARMIANESAALRRIIVALLSALRDERPLPRVWSS
jgi:urease accessory protein